MERPPQTFDPKLKVLYKISQIYGLAPFVYLNNSQKVFETSFATLYSLCFLILTDLLLLYVAQKTIHELSFNSETAIRLTNSAQSVLIAFTSISIHFVIFQKRKRRIHAINNSIEIQNFILKCWPGQRLYSDTFKYYYRLKKFVVISELISLLTHIAVQLYTSQDTFLGTFCWMLSLFFHATNSAIIGTQYYVSVLMVSEFYRILGEKLKFCANKVRNLKLAQKSRRPKYYCNLSDSYDQISILYSKISNLLQEVIEIFQFQVTLMTFTALLQLTTSVSKFIGKCLFCRNNKLIFFIEDFRCTFKYSKI